jgi:hypothetical protein
MAALLALFYEDRSEAGGIDAMQSSVPAWERLVG